ncbi:hypothetical protein KFK09_010229 [Dendrobium nobile]|uniref:Uncharacterized protein n=1 Tax=Dendrobium nobile TaxID=94219 RepID=A0A8T3BJG8_DENNO|nr:hypothetical protein KFK09_010229 [Dendrobium nobile]
MDYLRSYLLSLSSFYKLHVHMGLIYSSFGLRLLDFFLPMRLIITQMLDQISRAFGWERMKGKFEASSICFFVVAVRLCCFAGGVEIASLLSCCSTSLLQ